MEPIPLKDSLFCELHCFKVVGVLLGFFTCDFHHSSMLLSMPKSTFKTQGLWKHKENKKESVRRTAGSVCSLVRQKRGSGHKATFHHGLERVLKRHFIEHMVNN